MRGVAATYNVYDFETEIGRVRLVVRQSSSAVAYPPVVDAAVAYEVVKLRTEKSRGHHPTDIQDRDGAALVLAKLTRALFPFILRIFADAGYQGPRVALAAANTGSWIVEIVKRNELNKFMIVPKRRIVERTLAWISRNRRLARDFERYASTVAAFIRLAMIRIMLRRLTRSNVCP